MQSALYRTFGYLLPTTLVVAGLHLVREMSPGEAIDGAVSALFFTACFLGGAALEARSRAGGPGTAPWKHVREGLLIGVGAWLAIWAFWNLPQTNALRAFPAGVFGVNLLANLLAGLVRLPAPDPRRLALP
jgi:hypothetical protein